MTVKLGIPPLEGALHSQGHNYHTLDAVFSATFRVPAQSVEHALQIMRETLTQAEANFGAWDSGDPIIGEVTLIGHPALASLTSAHVTDAHNQPSCAQIAALKRFAGAHGPNWKSALRHLWQDGGSASIMEDDAAYLRQIRNDFGPSWLSQFRLPHVADGVHEATS